MKITLTLLSRDKSGRQRKTEMKGELLEGSPLNVLRELWEAERAINDHTSIRCHISVEDEQ